MAGSVRDAFEQPDQIRWLLMFMTVYLIKRGVFRPVGAGEEGLTTEYTEIRENTDYSI